MRIAIFGEGTRGDVWPLVALGVHMTQRGHEVTMTASEEFKPMVEAAGIRYMALPASLTAYIATEEGQRSLYRGGVSMMRGLQRFSHMHREQIEDAFIEAGEGADALLSFPITQDRVQCLAEARRVPHAIAHFSPLAPTADFPSYMMYVHDRPGALLLNAFSPSLVPKPRDWGAHRPITGFWQLPPTVRTAIDEGLPEDLATWIDAGEPPVFLGFGSMPVLMMWWTPLAPCPGPASKRQRRSRVASPDIFADKPPRYRRIRRSRLVRARRLSSRRSASPISQNMGGHSPTKSARRSALPRSSSPIVFERIQRMTQTPMLPRASA